MKKVIFTLLSIGVLAFNATAQYCGANNPSGPAQCTSDGSLDKPGLKPTTDSLPVVRNGVQVPTVIQFRNFDTIRVSPVTLVTVHTLTIDSINGLPAGLCWATNAVAIPNADPDKDVRANTYCNGAGNAAVTCPAGVQPEGCIKISGTTCVPTGVYRLKIKVLVDVGFATVPYDADEVGLKYYVRVNNVGEAETLLDTSQTAAFFPYGNAPTGCTSGINDVTSTVSSLNISPNPFNGRATATFTSDINGSMNERITNIIGSEVHNKNINVTIGENTSTIERSNLPTGVYFYSLTNGKNVITKRVVISE